MQKDFLCKQFRENNKWLEFCGRLNKSGLFVDIAVYYGRAYQGCVMIPSRYNVQRSGWSSFQKGLGLFLLGKSHYKVIPDTTVGWFGGQKGQLIINGN